MSDLISTLLYIVLALIICLIVALSIFRCFETKIFYKPSKRPIQQTDVYPDGHTYTDLQANQNQPI